MFYALELDYTRNLWATIDHTEAHLAAVTVDGEMTQHFDRVETKIIVTEDLGSLEDIDDIIEPLVEYTDYVSVDEGVRKFTPDSLSEATREMREAAETASVFDREEINRVVGIFEDALSTYMSEGATYTLRF